MDDSKHGKHQTLAPCAAVKGQQRIAYILTPENSSIFQPGPRKLKDSNFTRSFDLGSKEKKK